NYIRTTTTLTGLKVRARLLRKKYEKGEKISAQKMKHLALSRHKTQPKWNYTLRPM
ncbi:MAG: ISAzo13 family transposase, partial [Acidobacteria bacterium]